MVIGVEVFVDVVVVVEVVDVWEVVVIVVVAVRNKEVFVKSFDIFGKQEKHEKLQNHIKRNRDTGYNNRVKQHKRRDGQETQCFI